MRKSTKVMAGLGVVAGLGVALAPLATSAVGNMGTDTLTVNVNSSCTLDDGGTGTPIAINATWSGSGEQGTTITLGGDAAGNVKTVSFECTENSRVIITAETTGLRNGSIGTIAPSAIKAKYSGANGITITDGYLAAFGALSDTAVTVATGTAGSTDEMEFTVVGYTVDVPDDQAAGTYTGTVDYNFTLNNN